MPNVEISDHCHAVILSAARYPFKETGKRLLNGNWLIPLSEDVWTRVITCKHPNETMSDAIERIIITSERRLS